MVNSALQMMGTFFGLNITSPPSILSSGMGWGLKEWLSFLNVFSMLLSCQDLISIQKVQCCEFLVAVLSLLCFKFNFVTSGPMD